MAILVRRAALRTLIVHALTFIRWAVRVRIALNTLHQSGITQWSGKGAVNIVLAGQANSGSAYLALSAIEVSLAVPPALMLVAYRPGFGTVAVMLAFQAFLAGYVAYCASQLAICLAVASPAPALVADLPLRAIDALLARLPAVIGVAHGRSGRAVVVSRALDAPALHHVAHRLGALTLAALRAIDEVAVIRDHGLGRHRRVRGGLGRGREPGHAIAVGADLAFAAVGVRLASGRALAADAKGLGLGAVRGLGALVALLPRPLAGGRRRLAVGVVQAAVHAQRLLAVLARRTVLGRSK